ncbi:MAG: exosome complex protein Rrp42 [Candidatus Micrarchaeaceae archaeon]
MEIIDTIEGSYIKELLKQGKRLDSRGIHEFRNIKIAADVIEHAEGSAQVEIGTTKALVGIKMMVDEPMEDTPGMGNLIINAELLPLAYVDYEGGPPSPESIELARVVDRGIRAGRCIDLESLALEDEKVWSIYVDIYVLDYGGNLFDSSELAVMEALMHTKIPKYEDGKVLRNEREKNLKIDNIVTSATFGKIGDSLLLDPNINEESIEEARITIASDDENIRAIQKGLHGSFTQKEIEEAIDATFEQHEKLKKILG